MSNAAFVAGLLRRSGCEGWVGYYDGVGNPSLPAVFIVSGLRLGRAGLRPGDAGASTQRPGRWMKGISEYERSGAPTILKPFHA